MIGQLLLGTAADSLPGSSIANKICRYSRAQGFPREEEEEEEEEEKCQTQNVKRKTVGLQ